MMSGKVSGAVEAGLQDDNTDSEISVPDETISVSQGPTCTMNEMSELQEISHNELTNVEKTKTTENSIQTIGEKLDRYSYVNKIENPSHDTIGPIQNDDFQTAREENDKKVNNETKLEMTFDQKLNDSNIANAIQPDGNAENNSVGIDTAVQHKNSENFTKSIPVTEERTGEEHRQTSPTNQTEILLEDTAGPQKYHVDRKHIGQFSSITEAEEIQAEDIANNVEMQNVNIVSSEHQDLPYTKEELANRRVKGEEIQTEVNEVAKLTRENVEQHTKILCGAVTKSQTAQPENKTEESANDKFDEVPIHGKDNVIIITDNRGDSVVADKQPDISPTKNVSNSLDTIDVETFTMAGSQNDKITESLSKYSLQEKINVRNKETEKQEEKLVKYASSPILGLSQNKDSVQKSQDSKLKRKVKKKKISIDDIETLVSRDRWSNTEKRKRRKNKTDSNKDKAPQNNDLLQEDSGIEKDIEEQNDLFGNSAGQIGVEKDIRIDAGHASERRLLRRVRPPRYAKRPAYDTMNTSTQLILLNNKYGKHSRLRRGQENKPNRSLINPDRHSKEPTFYLSGDFHSRCSTSEYPVREKFPPSHFKFDFNDRPQVGQIGDRLYEARMSVNPNRHRTCNSTPEKKLKPLDFSPPYRGDTLPTYVFEWERLYAQPPTRPSRPSSLVRPPSTVSGKKFGKETVKIPLPHLT